MSIMACFDEAMTKADKQLPHAGAQAARAKAERAAREAAALRENLRRRKAQARSRDEGSAATTREAGAPGEIG